MAMLNLVDTVKLWQQHTPLEDTRHLSWGALRSLAGRQADDLVFAHLALCTRCRQRLWRFQELPVSHVETLAADAGIPQEATWTTADGKYVIEFRRLLDSEHGGVLVVRARAARDLEGTTLVVEDAHGRELLRGTVDRDGMVAAAIEDIHAISFAEFVITEG
jgi:hypothetical protein